MKYFGNSNKSSELESKIISLQQSITLQLENADGKGKFIKDKWERDEGGYGISMVLENGNVIEKGGVNFSSVHGKVPYFLLNEKQHSSFDEQQKRPENFYATGLSIVIHPENPMVPIIHMNIRYFEMDNGIWWFGGGIDLTPIYVDEEECRFFHRKLKSVCDNYHPNFYELFKKNADEYFVIKHRKECRGIGGIFFDRLNSSLYKLSQIEIENFVLAVGNSFAELYVSIINRKKNFPFTEEQKNWQLIRRGRYVEFNLVYDKGTKFGLETNGRIESILMSLPKFASWQYNFKPNPESNEMATLKILQEPVSWI